MGKADEARCKKSEFGKPIGRLIRCLLRDGLLRTIFCAWAVLNGFGTASGEDKQSLTKIPAGTTVEDLPTTAWSHILMLSKPKISDGATSEIPDFVRRYAEMFSLVVLAKVDVDESVRPPRRTFEKLGIGLASEYEGKSVVVSGSAADDANAPELGLLARQVLQTAEESLEETNVIARRETVIIYDSPAVIRVGQRNAKRIMRTMVWIEPQRGRINQFLWTLRRQPDGELVPALNQGVHLATPFTADRELYVDATQFTLGIPSKTAFALAKLPAGRPFTLDPAVANVATRKQYNAATLLKLAERLIIAIRSSDKRDGGVENVDG